MERNEHKRLKKKSRPRNRKSELREMLNNFESVQRFCRADDGTGALFIENRRCIGIRELIKSEFGDNIHEIPMRHDYEQRFTTKVFDARFTNAHERSIVQARMTAALDHENIVCEYPVGMESVQVTIGEDVRTLVGLVDILAYDAKNNSLAICEWKTLKTNCVNLTIPLIAVYQVMCAQRLLYFASEKQFTKMTQYVIVENECGLACWKINHTPEVERIDRHFIVK